MKKRIMKRVTLMIPAVPNKPNRPINTDLGSHRIV